MKACGNTCTARTSNCGARTTFRSIPVLVFDQFEELFSRSGGNVELITQVFDGLADLIENRIPADIASAAAGPQRSRLDLSSQRYRVVLSFREDFLPEVRTWEPKVPSLLRNYLRLEPHVSRSCDRGCRGRRHGTSLLTVLRPSSSTSSGDSTRPPT